MEKFHLPPFQQLLKEKGLKSTRQREEIARAFVECGTHLTVEELYRRVRQRNPRIGYATVYRTLKLMEESGWAAARQFGTRMARFEHLAAGEHHDHLICVRCGRIVEFSSGAIEDLQARVARRQGFHVFEHRLELYGHCAACLPKKGRGGARNG